MLAGRYQFSLAPVWMPNVSCLVSSCFYRGVWFPCWSSPLAAGRCLRNLRTSKIIQMSMFMHLYKRVIEVIFVIATGLKLCCCYLVKIILKYPDGEYEYIAGGCSKEL